MYGGQCDLQCISLYMLTFVKTHFISNQSTVVALLFLLTVHPLTYCKRRSDVARYLHTDNEGDGVIVREFS